MQQTRMWCGWGRWAEKVSGGGGLGSFAAPTLPPPAHTAYPSHEVENGWLLPVPVCQLLGAHQHQPWLQRLMH